MNVSIGGRIFFFTAFIVLSFFKFSSTTFSAQLLTARIRFVSISEKKIDTKIGSNLLVSHESRAGHQWRRNQVMDLRNPESAGFNEQFIEQCKGAGLSVLRFPGGMIANRYRWMNGIGPTGLRPASITDHGRNYINRFGTLEFATFCDLLGAEKIITVNAETADAREAANWVEFCNGAMPAHPDPQWTPDSYNVENRAPLGYFAWLRARYGSQKPVNVRYWEIGNEIILHKSPAYLARAIQFSKMMKQVDPGIKIGLSADSLKYTATKSFVRSGLSPAHFDFLAIHYYSVVGQKEPETSYYSNGDSYRDFHIAKGGDFLLKIEARGTPALTYPVMRIRVNNGPAIDIAVRSPEFRWYETTVALKPGLNRLKIGFINDANIPKVADCNLFVRRAFLAEPENRRTEIWNTRDLQYRYLFSNNVSIESHIREIQDALPDIPIYVTEANTGYGVVDHNQNGIAETMKLKSALWLAGLVHSAIRTNLPVLCHWLLNDRYGFGMVRPDRHVTPSFFIFPLYVKHQQNKRVLLKIDSPGFDTPMLKTTRFGKETSGTPYLDAIASRDETGQCLLTIINRHPTLSIETVFDFGSLKENYKIESMAVLNTAGSLGMEADNEGNPKNVMIRTASKAYRPGIPVSIEPHSITNIIFTPQQ